MGNGQDRPKTTADRWSGLGKEGWGDGHEPSSLTVKMHNERIDWRAMVAAAGLLCIFFS
jgi:hypothetical protein